MVWRRPENIEYPRVWHKFQGRKPMPDGSIPTFRVQDIPPKYFEAAVNFMCANFIVYEPICKATEMWNEEVSVRQLRNLWSETVKQKMALICFREDPSSSDGIFPEIVGVNVTYVACKDDKEIKMEGKIFPQVFGSVMYSSHLVDAFKKYGVEYYLSALGLSVAQNLQGQNIGAEILKARIPLCKATDIKVTVTAFTATSSQVLAKKVGFETIAEITYDDLKNKHGFAIGNVDTKDIKLMSIVIN